MKFVNKNQDTTRYIDTIFPIKEACKDDKDSSKVDATVGMLCDENGQIVAFDCVYKSLKSLSTQNCARYGEGSFGNKEYNKAISSYVIGDRIKHFRSIAVAGGTAGISLGFRMCVDEDTIVLLPSVAWGNYKNIAEFNSANKVLYDIYDLNKLEELIKTTNQKMIIIINSPCQNPCGLSYSLSQWERIINAINTRTKETIIINDVAYMDYAYDDNVKDYFNLFNQTNDNVLTMIAFSCSKSFSYYGMRLGALFIIHNDEKFLDEFLSLCAKEIRTNYSSCNNAAMLNISDVINNHLDELINERKSYIEVLKEKTSIFMNEADGCGLEYYQYNDGFFIALKIDDNNKRDEIHERLLKNHIYTIKINLGIRVAICSVPKNKVIGLAKRIKELY